MRWMALGCLLGHQSACSPDLLSNPRLGIVHRDEDATAYPHECRPLVMVPKPIQGRAAQVVDLEELRDRISAREHEGVFQKNVESRQSKLAMVRRRKGRPLLGHQGRP